MYWYNTVDNLYKQDKTKFLKLVELKAQIIRDTMGDFTTDEYGTALVLGFNPILWALCKDNVDLSIMYCVEMSMNRNLSVIMRI